MGDLISRQAALEMLNDNELERQADDVFDGDLHRYKRAAQRIIAQLPTIEPKRGKWIKIVDCDTVQCSECFEDFDYIDGLCYLCHGQELPDYCPNCGAKMERSEDGET